MADQLGENPYDRVDDIERESVPEEPPVPGAQWDEVHSRWERWDEDSASWVVVGEDAGDGVAPADENPLPAPLARELVRADDVEPEERYQDVDRTPAPGLPPEPGAQWNEVDARWERWDDTSSSWVPVDGDDTPATPPSA